MNEPTDFLTLGWREWVGLPALGIRQIKAKVDTGARTSALHAFSIQNYSEDGLDKVEFQIHPLQRDNDTIATCTADVLDKRIVTDSGGHKEERFVIATLMSIGSYSWTIEMTLTARDDMLFRMLLGRTAIKGRARVDPSRSYLIGKKKRRKKRKSRST